MGIHTSSVNFRKLIRDLAEMYNFPIPEVVITELVANSLDAKAETIKVYYDSKNFKLTIEDFGQGMTEHQFKEYHDFAADLKQRGTGIGFAGLGAKISFNIALKVITQTWSEKFKGGSNWFLKSNKELIWEDLSKLESLNHKGTKVEVFFNPIGEIKMYSEVDFKNAIIRQFLPLFDHGFMNIYNEIGYYKKIKFYLNNKLIPSFNLEKKYNLEKSKRILLKTGKTRIGFGIFGLSNIDYPIDENSVGIGISVYGKIIKFDLMNQFVGEITSKIFGIIEIPPLIKFLNTSKTEFIRHRTTSKEYHKYYEPARNCFKEWLSETGIRASESYHAPDAIRLEREIKKLIGELPELNQLFGSSYKSPTHIQNQEGEISGNETQGVDYSFPDGPGNNSDGEGYLDPGVDDGVAFEPEKEGQLKASPISRTKRCGLRINFTDMPDRVELSWVEGNIIFINSSHPSYIKIIKNNIARNLHNIFAISIAVDKELKERGIIEIQDSYINKIMIAWGKM